MSFFADDTCLRCGKKIDHVQSAWLELNNRTGLYCAPGTVPADDSQGGFEFGSSCAKAILKNGGEMVTVGIAKRRHG